MGSRKRVPCGYPRLLARVCKGTTGILSLQPPPLLLLSPLHLQDGTRAAVTVRSMLKYGSSRPASRTHSAAQHSTTLHKPTVERQTCTTPRVPHQRVAYTVVGLGSGGGLALRCFGVGGGDGSGSGSGAFADVEEVWAYTSTQQCTITARLHDSVPCEMSTCLVRPMCREEQL